MDSQADCRSWRTPSQGGKPAVQKKKEEEKKTGNSENNHLKFIFKDLSMIVFPPLLPNHHISNMQQVHYIYIYINTSEQNCPMQVHDYSACFFFISFYCGIIVVGRDHLVSNSVDDAIRQTMCRIISSMNDPRSVLRNGLVCGVLATGKLFPSP